MKTHTRGPRWALSEISWEVLHIPSQIKRHLSKINFEITVNVLRQPGETGLAVDTRVLGVEKKKDDVLAQKAFS